MKIDTAKPKSHRAELSQPPCLCAAVRKAGRRLTKQYDRCLKPSSLKITQFSMLANIGRNPNIAVTKLSELLVMDQSTVTRNLGLLEKAGYIHSEADKTDHRIRRIQITELGRCKMDEARPLWEKAQAEVERIIGTRGIENLLSSLESITG